MAECNTDTEVQKCVFCMLVDNLYPDKIAPSLFEDSGLSSGTLEEVTLTEGVTRRVAVKRILHGLVKYQKEKGSGRECIDVLVQSLPENYDYLLPYLDNASIQDLQKCRCVEGQCQAKFKVKLRNQNGDNSLPMAMVKTQCSQFNHEGHKVMFEGHQLMSLPRSPGLGQVGPDKEHRKLIICSCDITMLLTSGQWDLYNKYRKWAEMRFPDNVDRKLLFMLRALDAHIYMNNCVSEDSCKVLEEAKQLIPKSSCPLYFDLEYLCILSKVLRRQKQYGSVENYSTSFYQISHMFTAKTTMCHMRNHAEYLIHLFQSKFATNSVPERTFKRIEELLLGSIEQAAKVREFFRGSKWAAEYVHCCPVSGRRTHIYLSLLYLRCCITGEGITEDFDVISEDIRKAEQSLNKVVEEWETASILTQIKHLLARSDLHMRKKQHQMALEFAQESLLLCNRTNYQHVAHWAEKRISFLEPRLTARRIHPGEGVMSGCEAGSSSGTDSVRTVTD